MDIKNKEALIAEIEQFKEEALKMHIVQVLADTYERSSLFDHNINADGSVIWFKTQARQLWDFWQAAKAQAVPESNALLSAAMDAVQKLGSGDFVLVPKKPDVDKAWNIALKRIVPPPKINDVVQKELMCKKYVDDLCFERDRILLNYEEMIEAQEQSHD